MDDPTMAQREPALLRYAPYAILATVLAFAVRYGASPLTNYDTYFHLRFGREFLDGHWSLTNPGTVTRFATAHWVPTQWSSQILMAAAEKVGGLAAVGWLFGATLIGFILILYRSGRLFASPLVSAVSMLLALLASLPGVSARPQIISYIFVAVTTMAWLRTGQDRRLRWWLVPLTWVWATMHGMWPVGIAISGVAAVGFLLDSGASEGRRLRPLLIPALSAVAAAVTPVGPALYHAVFAVTSRRNDFSEWGPPVWTSLHMLILAAGIVALMLTLLRGQIRLTWLEAFLLVLALAWSLYSIRTVPVAATMLSPFIARALQSWLPKRPAPRNEAKVLAVLVLVAVAALTTLTPAQAGHVPSQPSWVQSTLSRLPNGTVIIDDESYGGYLMWRFPQLQLVMDGYGDTFTRAEMDRTKRLMTGTPGWIEDVAATGAQWAFLSTDSPLAYNLTHTMKWTTVHSSSDWILLHSPTSTPPGAPIG